MDYLKQEIIGQSRHQFIYGYNGKEREAFLKELANDFPVVADKNAPMAIYLTDFSLPIMDRVNQNIEINRLDMVAHLYFDFALLENILKKIIEMDGINKIEGRLEDYLKRINYCFVNKESEPINNLSDLLKAFSESREYYYNYYISYLNGTQILPDNDKLKISYVSTQGIIGFTKTLLNNTSYFAIIVDQQRKLPFISQKVINGYVTQRSNSDISMKVACDINEWGTYCNLNGVLAENVHDYGDVSFDTNEEDYIKKLKQNRQRR